MLQVHAGQLDESRLDGVTESGDSAAKDVESRPKVADSARGEGASIARRADGFPVDNGIAVRHGRRMGAHVRAEISLRVT